VKLKLTVDGKMYEVDVEVAEPEQPHPSYVPPTSPAHLPTAGTGAVFPIPSGHETLADENKVCRSPVAGVVVRVSAQVGQAIRANDVLLVLEAMKMETVITSPTDGTIARLHVGPGDSVKGGQVLVELE